MRLSLYHFCVLTALLDFYDADRFYNILLLYFLIYECITCIIITITMIWSRLIHSCTCTRSFFIIAAILDMCVHITHKAIYHLLIKQLPLGPSLCVPFGLTSLSKQRSVLIK